MRLRVRVRRQTTRIELQGEDPSLTELIQVVQDTVLTSHGLSAETLFSLSLNGSELLTDSGQTLSACGIVSGDLVSVVLPETPSGSNTQTQSNTHTQSRTHTQSNTQSNDQKNAPSDTLSQVSEISSVVSPPGGSLESPGPRVSSWEPMLCSEAEEGQVPLSLELLYHSAHSRTPSDALMVAVHLLMMETGFVSEDSQLKPPQMPPGWNSLAGAYKLQYSHPQCGGSVVRLVAVSMGPVLAVQPHLSIGSGGSSGGSSSQQSDSLERLCVNPSSYISLQPGGNAGEVFRDLRKLSRLFKDQLIYPLIAAAREAMSMPVLFGLAVLPPELLLRILRLLDVLSLLRLSSVCSHLHQVAADSTLWRHLYRRDFPESDSDRPRDTDWKELYKRSFKLRCDLRRPRHCSLPPFHRNPRNMLPHPPSFPLVPGIIGGEYDQRPALPQGFRPRYDPLGPLGDPDRMPPPLDLRVGQPPAGRGSSDIRRGFI